MLYLRALFVLLLCFGLQTGLGVKAEAAVHGALCNSLPTNKEIGVIFQQMEIDYPAIARQLTVGTTWNNAPIYAIRLSAFPDTESAEPEIRISGGIHPFECSGIGATLQTAEWLVTAYGTDPFVTRLLDNAEITVMPVLNPDGYSGFGSTRYNAAGVDLNRNFYFAWTGDDDGGSAPFSEMESRALRDFSEANTFVMSVSYHVGIGTVNVPWAYTPAPSSPPDAALLTTAGNAYIGISTYELLFQWPDAFGYSGGLQDWSLGTAGTFDWIIEMMMINEVDWDVHQAGLPALLSFVFQGAKGLVTDAVTGAPLLARISIQPVGAPIFTDPDVGDYHRMLPPGIYDITAHAQGYAPKTVKGIEVTAGEMSRVDMALEREEAPVLTAFKVMGMSLPLSIGNDEFGADNPYLNHTMVWDALGEPDGIPYALSTIPEGSNPDTAVQLNGPLGSITLDMGATGLAVDREGPDLRVVSTETNDAAAAVSVAQSEDGPFVLTATSSGTFDIDIAGTGFDTVRYVRVADASRGPFNDPFSGYNLDAVVNLSTPISPPDAGSPEEWDAGASNANDVSSESCGCAAIGKAAATEQLKRMLMLLGI